VAAVLAVTAQSVEGPDDAAAGTDDLGDGDRAERGQRRRTMPGTLRTKASSGTRSPGQTWRAFESGSANRLLSEFIAGLNQVSVNAVSGETLKTLARGKKPDTGGQHDAPTLAVRARPPIPRPRGARTHSRRRRPLTPPPTAYALVSGLCCGQEERGL
jgi:hypothetical protein